MAEALVKPADSRPIGPAGHCTYCREPVGSPHKSGCVITWEDADPCPFCGSTNVKYEAVDVEAVMCMGCGAIGPDTGPSDSDPESGAGYRAEHDRAVRAWNARATDRNGEADETAKQAQPAG